MKINEIINEVANQPKGVAEGLEHYDGIDISLEIQKDDEYVDDEDYDNQVIYVTASSNGRELGHVLFAFDGEYLMPQDLEVDERYQGQGIAATMYDYVKSKGYKIRRGGQQTDAGAGFWDKHKPGKNVWEQGVAEELSEEFDLIESIIDQIADQNGVDSEVVWDDLESLTEDELYAFAVTSQLNEDWQKVNKKDKTDGMSQKAVNAYRREHPGSKLKTAVTTKPSKLKRGSKASKRRSSYCSRSKGQMKMHNISCAKTPDKAICKARRRWNC